MEVAKSKISKLRCSPTLPKNDDIISNNNTSNIDSQRLGISENVLSSENIIDI
jgi:hypothetical protein